MWKFLLNDSLQLWKRKHQQQQQQSAGKDFQSLQYLVKSLRWSVWFRYTIKSHAPLNAGLSDRYHHKL